MKVPIKPQKRITISDYEVIASGYSKLPIQDILVGVEIAGKQNMFLELSLDGEHDYDACNCNPVLQLIWEEEIDNPHYDKEMKKYETKMKKWKKENANI
jgi:hypothetical protein